MKRTHLLASTALAIGAAFMSEVTEVVLAKAKNGNGDLVRVNKSDFDADQALDSADRQYTAAPAKSDEPEQSVGGTMLNTDGPPLAAPSAPDFNGGNAADTLPIDPLKNAAAPIAPGPNSRAVLKKGKKYHAVDANTGETLKLDGIEAGGYDTEEAAWTAIRALPH